MQNKCIFCTYFAYITYFTHISHFWPKMYISDYIVHIQRIFQGRTGHRCLFLHRNIAAQWQGPPPAAPLGYSPYAAPVAYGGKGFGGAPRGPYTNVGGFSQPYGKGGRFSPYNRTGGFPSPPAPTITGSLTFSHHILPHRQWFLLSD